MFRIPVVIVKSTLTGEMDYADFRAKLKENADKPAIVTLNIGTTVKGAVDSVAEAQAALAEAGIPKESTYIHIDGALAGMMLPFLGPAPAESPSRDGGAANPNGRRDQV